MEGSRLHLMAVRFKGLFANRQLTLSTLGLWLLWLLVGIGYPVFNIFLPTFLLKFTPAGQTPPTQVRILANTAIAQGCSTFGPVIAAAMCAQPYIGRRRTMAFGAVLTAIFMFAWTRSKTSMESVGFPVAIGVALNRELELSKKIRLINYDFSILRNALWLHDWSVYLFELPG